jgi:hypothetical protein
MRYALSPRPEEHMKIINHLAELKKGDTVIIKNARDFEKRGLMKITGDVFNIDHLKPEFTIKCKETSAIERINFDNAKIFLLDGY